jgi:hypothetical protein
LWEEIVGSSPKESSPRQSSSVREAGQRSATGAVEVAAGGVDEVPRGGVELRDGSLGSEVGWRCPAPERSSWQMEWSARASGPSAWRLEDGPVNDNGAVVPTGSSQCGSGGKVARRVKEQRWCDVEQRQQ